MDVIKREVVRLDPVTRTATRAAMDELAAAIEAHDGDAGVAAIRRIQALSPEVGNAVMDHLADDGLTEGLRRMAGGKHWRAVGRGEALTGWDSGPVHRACPWFRKTDPTRSQDNASNFVR